MNQGGGELQNGGNLSGRPSVVSGKHRTLHTHLPKILEGRLHSSTYAVSHGEEPKKRRDGAHPANREALLLPLACLVLISRELFNPASLRSELEVTDEYGFIIHPSRDPFARQGTVLLHIVRNLHLESILSYAHSIRYRMGRLRFCAGKPIHEGFLLHTRSHGDINHLVVPHCQCPRLVEAQSF